MFLVFGVLSCEFGSLLVVNLTNNYSYQKAPELKDVWYFQKRTAERRVRGTLSP